MFDGVDMTSKTYTHLYNVHTFVRSYLLRQTFIVKRNCRCLLGIHVQGASLP